MSKWFWFPAEKRSTVKGKNLLLVGANSFLLQYSVQHYYASGCSCPASKLRLLMIIFQGLFLNTGHSSPAGSPSTCIYVNKTIVF